MPLSKVRIITDMTTSEQHIDDVKGKYLLKIVEELCATDKKKISDLEARDTTNQLKKLAEAVLGTSSRRETKGLDEDGARDLVCLNVGGRKFQIPRKTINKSKFLEAAAISSKEDGITLPDVDPDVFSDFVECLTHNLPCPCVWNAEMKAQCENYFSATLKPAESVTRNRVKMGQKCTVKRRINGQYHWYPGTVAGIDYNCRYHVKFDDGHQEYRVPKDSICCLDEKNWNAIGFSHGVLAKSLKILEDTKKYHSYTVKVQNDPICSVLAEVDKKKLQDQLDSSIQKAVKISKSISDALSRMKISVEHNNKRKPEISHLTVNARGEMIMFPASIISRSDFLRVLFSVYSPETTPFVDFHPRILRHVFGAMNPKPLCSNKAHHVKKLNESIHFSRHVAGCLATDIMDYNMVTFGGAQCY